MIKFETPNSNNTNSSINNGGIQQLLSDTTNMVSPLSLTPTISSNSQSSSISHDSSTTLNLINQSHNLNDLSKLHTLISSSSVDNTQASVNGGENDTVILEIGVIEKVLNGYGFIKCYNREQLLFFNYPYYYQGPVNALKAGDLVEFEPTVDKRTGKTIATNLVKHQDKQNQQRLQQQQQKIETFGQNPQQIQQNRVVATDEANINLNRLKVSNSISIISHIK